MYKAQVVNRGYKDNNLALLQEVLCATNDAYNYNYNIDALQTYVASAFTGTVSYEDNKLVAGSGTVTFSNASATPKYGVLENGVLKNDGYTEESWQNYVDALAEAVASVKNASTALGYETGMYTPSAGSFDHQVSDINTLRTNLMIAENKLEKAAVSDGYTVSGKIVAMLDPSAPNTATGAPALANVTVTVGDQVATTDASGEFKLTLANGSYQATIHYANGYDRVVTINVNGADINAGTITMVSCDYDNNGIMNVKDSFAYLTALGSNDLANGDLNGDGVVNVKDSFIFYSFLGAIDITNVYPETVIK